MANLEKYEPGPGPPTSLELRPETVKAYRNELRRARVHASLPKQDELAELAIGTCFKILSEREEKCQCSTSPIAGHLKSATRVNALCQPCKRAHWALTMVVELERLVNDRIKIDAGLLKLSAERVSGANDAASDQAGNAVELIRAAQDVVQQRALESRQSLKSVDATICTPVSPDKELVIDEPPSTHLQLAAVAK